jgi:hypothetical protein
MSRPMISRVKPKANPKRKSEAATFHRSCFKAWGDKCFFCGGKATDAMHVIARAKLGPLRYEIPVQNSRPGCRACHDRQGAGELKFPIGVLRTAISAHNKIAKVPMEMP